MKDYDVIIIGGGINGLTVAAYLAKSGLSVGVFEARGQCGAHCDTVELGIPGYLHNLHATWLATGYSPAMTDLDLPGLGFELRGTDVTYAKCFESGRNLLHAMDFDLTYANWARISEADAAMQLTALEFNAVNLDEMLEVNRRFWYGPPTADTMEQMYKLLDGFLASQGHSAISGVDLLNMTGFEALDLLFESDEVKTTTASAGWISGLPPIHRKLGPLAAVFMARMVGRLRHTVRLCRSLCTPCLKTTPSAFRSRATTCAHRAWFPTQTRRSGVHWPRARRGCASTASP